MAYAALNGQRIISASVTIPFQGTWTADVTLASTASIPAGARAVTITMADLTLVGTTVRTAEFSGSRTARIVGGAGGWRKKLDPKGYSYPAGVRLKSVLDDAARESGETMAAFPDTSVGSFFTREEGRAEETLGLFAPAWWMGLDGATHIDARAGGAITSKFTVVAWSGAKGSFEIATENLKDWMPGRSFTSPTVTSAQTISTTHFTATNEGKLRITILNTRKTRNRLLDDIRAIIRREIVARLPTFACVWEYTIATATAEAADLIASDERLPNLTRVPLQPGLMGEKVTPAPGATCLVAFVNGDPTRPIVWSIEGVPPLLIQLVTAASPGGAGLPVLRQDALALGVFPISPGPSGPATVLT